MGDKKGDVKNIWATFSNWTTTYRNHDSLYNYYHPLWSFIERYNVQHWASISLCYPTAAQRPLPMSSYSFHIRLLWHTGFTTYWCRVSLPGFISSVAYNGDALSLRAARCEGSEDVEGKSPLHRVVVAPLHHTVHATPGNKYIHFITNLHFNFN